jgi:Na+/proline symporter
MSDTPKLGAFDYVVLILILLISILIGLYHGFKNQLASLVGMLFKNSKVTAIELVTKEENGDMKENENEDESERNPTKRKEKVTEYLTAQSSMGIVPIAFSLLASFFSATGIVGTPAEVLQFGFQFWLTSFAYAIPPVLGALVTGPFFAKLDILSVFEYFELRYKDRRVKQLGTICYALRNFMSLALVTFGPATAFSLIMGLDQNWSIAIVGFIGTLYTAVGGMKAVLWTDLFQVIIMITSNLFIVVKGVYDAGGVSRVFEINQQGGRFNMLVFDPDPFLRHSFWSLTFGAASYFT